MPTRQRSAVFWTLSNEAIAVGSSVLVFWLLARLLTPDEYGLLGGLVAVCAVIGPLAACGAGALMMRELAGDVRPGKPVGAAIGMTALGTFVGVLLIVVFTPIVVEGVDRTTAFLFSVGNLTATWLTELVVLASNTLNRQRLGAEIRVAQAFIRLGSFAVYAALVDDATLRGWALTTLVAGVLGVLLAHAYFAVRVRSAPHVTAPALVDFRKGAPFAFGSSAEGFLDASDRPVLLHYGFRAEAGTYSAAYRIVSVAYVPLLAILRSFDRALWQKGQEGIAASYSLARHLMTRVVPAAVLTSGALALAAEVIVSGLPDSYAETAPTIRLLAILPVIKAVQFPLGNALTVSGMATLRLGLTVLAALLNLGMNLLMVPSWNWRGAVVATIVAEVVLALAFVVVLQKRQRASLQKKSLVTAL